MTCRCEDCATAPGTCNHCIGLEQGQGWDAFNITMLLLMVIGWYLVFKRDSAELQPA